MTDTPRCHGCASDAIVVVRVTPYSAVTLLDALPLDVAACASHIQAAKQIGEVSSATPLGTGVTIRTVRDD